MEESTLKQYACPTKNPKRTPRAEPAYLDAAELAAFRRCRDEQIWVEQEHIPQDAVLSAFRNW